MSILFEVETLEWRGYNLIKTFVYMFNGFDIKTQIDSGESINLGAQEQ